MQFSTKDIYNIFKYIADNCELINEFDFGNNFDFNEKNITLYPKLYVLSDIRISYNYANGNNARKDYNIRFAVIDKPYGDWAKKPDQLINTLAKCEIIAEFVVQALRKLNVDGFSASENVVASSMWNWANDKVTGVLVDYSFSTPPAADNCELPFPDDFDINEYACTDG